MFNSKIFMHKYILIFTINLWFISFLQAQPEKEKRDLKLESELLTLIAPFKGDVGIYVHHLKSHKTVSIKADSIFPSASLIKVPILITLFDRINKGEINKDSMLIFKDSLRYSVETDLLASMRDTAKVNLEQIAMLAVSLSDNTAALWCQTIAGTGININNFLKNNNFEQTRINSRTPGRKAEQNKYGWGQTTPREMAYLFIKLRQKKIINENVSEKIYRYLGRSFWDGEALSQIPPYINKISKQGTVSKSRSEVVLVNAPHGDYVFCVITNNQKDVSTKPNNEGYILLRSISRTIWQHFEKKSKWIAGDLKGK